jgi:small subunit ribosomal protein S6
VARQAWPGTGGAGTGPSRRSVTAIVRRLPGQPSSPRRTRARESLEAGITPYEIMIILDPDADEEQQQEILERVQQLIRDGGGVVEHVDDWGRRRIAYPINKRPDGRYVVITSAGAPGSLEEIGRVLSISDVCLRAFFVRLSRAEAERASAVGAPAPADAHPDGDSRPPRGGRGGPRPRRPR